MWKCDKCGREFQNTHQDHYCGSAPQTIDEYIDTQPEAIRPILSKARDTIRSAAPEAMEKISWRMPTFWQGENLIHFAAFKKHLGIYPGDLTLMPFADKLTGYHTTKGAIQFPYDKPIPYDLIAEMTAFRVRAATEAQADKRKGGVPLKASAEFTVKDWKQTDLPDERGSLPVMRVSAAFVSEGAILGSFSVEYVMHYEREAEGGAEAGEARYAGILCFDGEVDGKSGSFALEDSGVYRDGVPASELRIIGYSGTGDLAGISGSGRYYAENGKMIVTLDYAMGR